MSRPTRGNIRSKLARSWGATSKFAMPVLDFELRHRGFYFGYYYWPIYYTCLYAYIEFHAAAQMIL
jgi:hypothetical protein